MRSWLLLTWGARGRVEVRARGVVEGVVVRSRGEVCFCRMYLRVGWVEEVRRGAMWMGGERCGRVAEKVRGVSIGMRGERCGGERRW